MGRRPFKEPTRTGHKFCSVCGIEKPLDDFHRQPSAFLGRNSYCKPCKKAKLNTCAASTVEDIAARFWAKVDRRGPDECWPWLAAKNPKGYGVFGFFGAEGKQTFPQAHRTAWWLMMCGPLPEYPLILDHVCRRRECVNPAHLRVLPQYDNCVTVADSPHGINSRKTSCKHGHPLSGDNLARVLNRGKSKSGLWLQARYCLTCWPSMHGHPRRFWIPEDLPNIEVVPARPALCIR